MRRAISASPFAARASHRRRSARAARHGAERRTRSPIRALVSRHQCSARANQAKVMSWGSTSMKSRPTKAVPSTLAATMMATPSPVLPWLITQSASSLSGKSSSAGARKSSRATIGELAEMRASSRCRCSQRASAAAKAVSGRQPHSSMKMTIAARTRPKPRRTRHSAVATFTGNAALDGGSASSAAVERPARLGGDGLALALADLLDHPLRHLAQLLDGRGLVDGERQREAAQAEVGGNELRQRGGELAVVERRRRGRPPRARAAAAPSAGSSPSS